MIQIQERVCDKLPGLTSLFINFKYNADVVAEIKSLPNFSYNAKTYTWEVPITSLSWVLDKLCIYDDIDLTLLPTVQQKSDTVFELGPYKTNPFDYQLQGIQYGCNHDNFLLLDAPGLGKSLQSIFIAQERHKMGQVKHCLIICGVNSLKPNWKSEILSHSDLSCRILGEKITRRGTYKIGGINERLAQLKNPIDEFFVVTNIETLRDEKIVKELVSGKNNQFDMCIFDEAHKCKDPTSQQSRGLLKLRNIKYKIAMTGTLLISSPMDAYVPLKWIGVEHGTYTNFRLYYSRFADEFHRILLGYQNIHMLQNQLSTCSIRRTKDILQLPEKTVINEMLEMDTKQQQLYDEIENGIIDQVDKVELNVSCILAMLGRLRQATACPSMLTSESIPSAKIERACDIVEEICSDNVSKVVIFSSFIETTKVLAEKLADYNPIVCADDIDAAEILRLRNLFQEDNSHKVLIATWQKMGTGHTLTRAQTEIFIDTPYTAAEFQQAQDRCHRIGTTGSVSIYNLICKDTVDERVAEIVQDKELLSDYIIDGKISEQHTQRLRQIIRDLRYRKGNN